MVKIHTPLINKKVRVTDSKFSDFENENELWRIIYILQ